MLWTSEDMSSVDQTVAEIIKKALLVHVLPGAKGCECVVVIECDGVYCEGRGPPALPLHVCSYVVVLCST